jgi:hypothetical protein
MAVLPTPDEIVDKWGRRLKAATEDIKRGVEKVSVAPSQEAIKKKDLLKKQLIEAIEKGRWEKQLAKVTLDDWKTKMVNVGVGRISSGVDAAKDKMTDFATYLVKAVNEARAEIRTPYTGDIENSVARAAEFIRAMAKRPYKG